MDDDDYTLELERVQAGVAVGLVKGRIVDEGQLLVLARRVCAFEVGDLGARDRRQSGVDDLALELLRTGGGGKAPCRQ